MSTDWRLDRDGARVADHIHSWIMARLGEIERGRRDTARIAMTDDGWRRSYDFRGMPVEAFDNVRRLIQDACNTMNAPHFNHADAYHLLQTARHLVSR